MRISDSNQINSTSQSELASVKSAAESTGSSRSSKAGSSGGQDQVSLSNVPELLRANASDRAEKIASLTATVRAGQYDVPPELLSKSIVTETLARSGVS